MAFGKSCAEVGGPFTFGDPRRNRDGATETAQPGDLRKRVVL